MILLSDLLEKTGLKVKPLPMPSKVKLNVLEFDLIRGDEDAKIRDIEKQLETIPKGATVWSFLDRVFHSVDYAQKWAVLWSEEG